MTVANLFARIGIKADTDKAKEFSVAMKNVTGDLKAAAIGAVAFTAAVVASMKGALDTAKVYRDFQNESGASTDELQRWQAVAAGANVSTSDLAESVKGLAQNREKIKLGGGNMSGFAFLGINPMDDPFSILDQLRTKTAGLPQAMKANLLSQMGVSSQFLQILNLTNAEFDKMRGGAFIIPSSAFAAMNQMQGSLNGLGKMVEWFQALLAERLAPIIDKVVKQVMRWVQENKNGLIDGIVKGTQFILKFVTAIVSVATWIGKIVDSTIGWKNALIAFGVVWAIFNKGLLASPIAWIIGGILLLIAVMDDLHAALGIDGDTRKSFFGGLFKSSPEMKKMFEGLFGIFKDIGKALGQLFNGDLKGFDETMKKLGKFGEVMTTLIHTLGDVGTLIGDLIGGDFAKLSEDFGNMAAAAGAAQGGGTKATKEQNIQKYLFGDLAPAGPTEAFPTEGFESSKAARDAYKTQQNIHNSYEYTFSTANAMTQAERFSAEDWIKALSDVQSQRKK
jgi:hypothetical protein